MNKISIIIPVLNEVKIIQDLLIYLKTHTTPANIAQIIIVDGGSTDGTQNIINNIKNVTLLHSKKGRAKQMNFGAKQATGHILYFLHADSFPPKNFDTHIINAVKKEHKAGCFRMQFNSTHWWLRLASWFTQFSWRACRGGDQSLFITKKLFNTIGGYNEAYIIYEDNILINELYARKQFVVINKIITTSARLYEKHGVWKLQYHFWAIYVKKIFGANASSLYAYYKKYIN